jgi:predicted transcriptional regulator
MKDAVHSAVHRSVHLFGERKLLGDLRLRITRRLILDMGKTPDWAGATPLLTAFSRPNQSGVAPARHARSVTVACPRTYTDVINLMQRRNDSEQRKEKIAMAVLKAPLKQPKTTVVQLRLDDEAKTKLAKYAKFLDCSPSYVVMEALKLVYNKDKEFQAWLSGEHTSNYVPSSEGESFQLELK